MEQTRVYRKNPIAWWDKPTMRYLRRKYGADKKTYLMVRSVYLALCEIESDFTDTPVASFTATVGTYAGVSRGVAGKYLKVLEEEKLISRVRLRDPHTRSYAGGTIITILEFRPDERPSDLLSGYPNSRVPQQWDTPTVAHTSSIKKITNDKKISNSKNVGKAGGRGGGIKEPERIAYYATEIARKLGDEKSISFYKLCCSRYNPDRLLRKAAEIMADGGARNPGAVFVDWLQKETAPQEERMSL